MSTEASSLTLNLLSPNNDDVLEYSEYISKDLAYKDNDRVVNGIAVNGHGTGNKRPFGDSKQTQVGIYYS